MGRALWVLAAVGLLVAHWLGVVDLTPAWHAVQAVAGWVADR